jgi:hypothetical protein
VWGRGKLLPLIGGYSMSANTDFCLSVIGGLSGTVGLSAEQLQFIVNDATEAYGVETEAEMTDTAKKNSLLRYFTWVRVRDELILDPSAYKTDGESFDFKSERLDRRVQEAYVKAYPYLSEGQIDQDRMDFIDDPYGINGQVEHNA